MSVAANPVPQNWVESRASLPSTRGAPANSPWGNVSSVPLGSSVAVELISNSNRRDRSMSNDELPEKFLSCSATATKARRCIELNYKGHGSLMRAIDICSKRTGIPSSYFEAWWYGRGGKKVLRDHAERVDFLHRSLLQERMRNDLLEFLGAA